MPEKMNKRLIEVRIQNIIDLDKAINRQLAIKTKSINNKLQQHGRTIEKKQLDHFEKSRLCDESTKIVDEYEELWESTLNEIVQLKQQIQRIKKKITDAPMQNPSCKLSNVDRSIHVKRELKLKILNRFTKLFLADQKSSNRLKGYVTKETEFIPFEIKCNASAKNAANSDELWQSISVVSEYQNKWDDLLHADEATNTYTNSTF